MSKIQKGHLERAAYIYIRQSTLSQVQHNLESQRRQYALVERAQELGWHEIRVVDEDMGRSGSGQGVPPKLIIFNGFLVGAGAQHCQGQIHQRDRFATTMTIPTRNGDFGATRAGSEWPARRAHSTACPNA